MAAKPEEFSMTIKSIVSEKLFPPVIYIEEAVIGLPDGTESGNWQTKPTQKSVKYVRADVEKPET
jgi:hypothetical protein